jgi:CheY-like chemotaxis protein
VASDVVDLRRGDPARLRQIVVNLVGNAIKFTSHGEVAIAIESDEGGQFLHFIVSDTGAGIPLAKQRSIFDPFSQADSSTTRQYGGTGLGLTISTRLIELMGGKIWVESQVGQGARFHFTARLPPGVGRQPCDWGTVSQTRSLDDVNVRVAKGIPEAPAAAQSLHAACGTVPSLNLLVAEDNVVNQLLMTRLLEKRGHRVTMASTGREALEALERDRYDMVFMDVQMPEMSGLEATKAIREGEKSPGIHMTVVALTAHAMKGDRERCLAAGMDDYLSKPIAAQELDDVLTRHGRD